MSIDLRHKAFFTVSVVVPVYNSEAMLVELVDRLQTALSGTANAFEIILVNDGSHDHSWQVIRDVVARYPSVRGIDLMRNYGQHNALLAGIRRARYEIIVTIDDDLQHPPEEIPKLLTKLSEGYDIVYGKPARRNHSAWRNVFSKMLKMALRVVLGAEIAAHSSAFRAFRSVLRRGFDGFTGGQLALDVLLSWSAARVTHVRVEHCPRRAGKSGYTFGKLVLLAFNMLSGYSTVPLRLASSVGLATSVIGLLLFFTVTIRRLFQTNYVPGFAFIASEVALFAGLQLFAIGVIGEYVARLYFRAMGQPPYVIRREAVSDVFATENTPGLIQEVSGDQALALVEYHDTV